MHLILRARLVLPAAAAVLLAGLGAAVVLQPVPTRAATPVERVAAAPAAAAPAPAQAPAAAVEVEAGLVARSAPSPRRAAVAATAAARRTAAAAPLTVQQRGERALASLEFPWRSLGYAVVFRPYRSDGTLGTASSRTRTITVYVKQRQDETELRATIAHELGHALDYVHATNERRAEYRRIRGLGQSGTWFPCNGCEDFASPAGDWAEVFAASLVGTGDFRSRMAGPPSAAQLRELRALFRLPAPQRAAASSQAEPAAAPTEEPAPEDEPEDRGLPLVGRGLTG